MNILTLYRSVIVLAVGVSAMLIAGCVATGGYGNGYGYGGGADYYQPYGTNYGGWYPGYNVGPHRGRGEHQPGGGEHQASGGQATHAFRAAPASRAMPSIPSASHSGGTHGGGRR